jgi:type IX secretion system PorP/SprF family membrane protein
MKFFNFYLPLFFFVCGSLLSQDAMFINSNQSLINLNPSFAGSNGGIRNQLSYRSPHSPSLSYYTCANSFDFYLKPLRGGLALSIVADNFSNGFLKNTIYGLAYAQHLSFLEGHLKIIPSVQLNYGSKTENLEGIISPNSNVPLITHKSYFSGGAGFLVDYKRDFKVGAYLFNVNQPDDGLFGYSRLPYRMLLHASYTKHLSQTSFVQFFGRYDRQQFYNRIAVNANLLFCKYYIAGLGYVNRDAAAFNLGIRTDIFTLQAGYEITISKLAGNTAGTWEFHVAFNLRSKELRHELTNFENW